MNLLPRLGLPALLALCLSAPGGLRAQFIEEVPFITSPDNVTLEMLRIAGVGASDHVIDLGSGDGRIVILAAKRFGATGLGVEIVPELVERSLRSARDAGVADKVDFRIQDLFKTDLSRATVITMYLLPEFNLQLRPLLLALKPGTRLVSHDWDMGDWKPDQTTVVPVPDKKVGLEKSSKIHFWTVPAPVAGLWCGEGPLAGFSLKLTQRYQEIEGSLARGERVRTIQARMQGPVLQTQSTSQGALRLELAGQQLRVAGGEGPLALAQGTRFRRASGASCG